MLVLDELLVSDQVLDFLEDSQEPVFDNEVARTLSEQGRSRNILEGETKVQKRIVCLSELQFDACKMLCTKEAQRALDLCKDKAESRRVLAPLYPDYIFGEYSHDELFALDPAGIAYPVVLKPSTGFFSLGIYPLFSETDFAAALDDIKANSATWSGHYNEGVINDSLFLIESYIEGQEYALDAYYDHEGKAVVLDILQHDFAGADDVSDRLYYTSKAIIERELSSMTEFLDACNERFGFRDFPVHVEVRKEANGRVVPIEFNPMRFAGLCSTDVSYHAYGFKTYEMYLRSERPDWASILAGKDGVSYGMFLLTSDGVDAKRTFAFDYDAVCARFSKVFELRKTDYARLGTFGFMFAEIRDENWDAEVEPFLHADLIQYLSYE